jgi:glutamate-1-semialdehyde 2,1-aminomutase
MATFGIPGSPGVTEGAARDTLTVSFNDVDALVNVVTERGDAIAAVIVEPVAANMGVVPPEPGFLEHLRELATVHGALLVFDEVITGFRIAFGGAQSVYAVTPDLTILGKVMGGGFPCAAFGGRRDVMERLAPVGPVYQAGTLSGNPVAVAAGIATLDLAKELDPYPALAETASAIADGLTERLSGGAVTVNRAGSMLSLFFAAGPVRDFAGANAADHERYARLFHHLLDRGVWLPPSGYELWTLGTEHGPTEVELVLNAVASFEG